MKTNLDEIQKLQKIAGIVKEGYTQEETGLEEAQNLTPKNMQVLADMLAYYNAKDQTDFIDVTGEERYPTQAQELYKTYAPQYRQWLINLQKDPMYKLHQAVKKSRGEYGGFN